MLYYIRETHLFVRLACISIRNKHIGVFVTVVRFHGTTPYHKILIGMYFIVFKMP